MKSWFLVRKFSLERHWLEIWTEIGMVQVFKAKDFFSDALWWRHSMLEHKSKGSTRQGVEGWSPPSWETAFCSFNSTFVFILSFSFYLGSFSRIRGRGILNKVASCIFFAIKCCWILMTKLNNICLHNTAVYVMWNAIIWVYIIVVDSNKFYTVFDNLMKCVHSSKELMNPVWRRNW